MFLHFGGKNPVLENDEFTMRNLQVCNLIATASQMQCKVQEHGAN